jgi:hypothetical protein
VLTGKQLPAFRRFMLLASSKSSSLIKVAMQQGRVNGVYVSKYHLPSLLPKYDASLPGYCYRLFETR